MNKCTYGDFLKSPEKISTNILASKLQNLEENGIIEKMHHPDSKIKIPYRLTEKWIDLLPLLVEIYLWADMYSDIPDEIKTTLEEVKRDKDTFIKHLTKELKQKLEKWSWK